MFPVAPSAAGKEGKFSLFFGVMMWQNFSRALVYLFILRLLGSTSRYYILLFTFIRLVHTYHRLFSKHSWMFENMSKGMETIKDQRDGGLMCWMHDGITIILLRVNPLYGG